MENVFITKIALEEKLRNLEPLQIELSNDCRKHLILTGKNGSGKTTLLEELGNYLSALEDYRNSAIQINALLGEDSNDIKMNGMEINEKTTVEFNYQQYIPAFGKEIIRIMFRSERWFRPSIPKSIEKYDITKEKTDGNSNYSYNIVIYMLNLYFQLSYSESEEERSRIQSWLANFESALQDIYNCPQLKLRLDAKALTVRIEMPGYPPFSLNEMADGYSALVSIVAELIMRMDTGNAVVDYLRQGIVLIDEVETHLHVELQKKVLPFLTRMFPNVQFIVTTHSPFVVTSLADAVVFDMEKRERLENLSAYSYETIIEAYFDTDMYSDRMRSLLDRYQELSKKDRTAEESEEFLKAQAELELVPPAAKELYIAYRSIEATRKAGQNDKDQ